MLTRIFSLLLLLSYSLNLHAASTAATIRLEHAPIDVRNTQAIERGAKFFAQNCMVCHTMKYLTYNTIARKAGITAKTMPLAEKEWTLGTPPPDLSLVASIRGVDWLYTYLHSFYKDPKQSTGSNNLLMPNTSMPNILLGFQGEQALINGAKSFEGRALLTKPHWYDRLKLIRQGSMTPEQYNHTITDVVDFFAYASDPHQLERERLGWWVIGFLIILAVLMVLLKKEIWRDIK